MLIPTDIPDLSDEALYFVYGKKKPRNVPWTNSEFTDWHPSCSEAFDKHLEAGKYVRNRVILHRMRWDDYDISHLSIY